MNIVLIYQTQPEASYHFFEKYIFKSEFCQEVFEKACLS